MRLRRGFAIYMRISMCFNVIRPISTLFSARIVKKKSIYNQLGQRKGSGAMKKLDKCATDAYLKASQSQEVYLRESLKLLRYASSIPMGVDGTVRYVTRYSQSSSGYRGRVYAQGVALSKAPRRLRQISYDGMGVRDWDVEMAYFTLATQIVDKLRIQIKCPYFNMDTLRLYIRDKHAVWGSLREHGDISNDERKRLCNAVFSGGAVAEKYMANAYIQNIAREGRATRWLACHLLSDVYGKLATDEKNDGQSLARSRISWLVRKLGS